MTRSAWGISVAICCHDSASRLPPTLDHLARQEYPGVPWEVVVVDNASTDGTASLAHDFWPDDISVPLRVIHEPRLGVAYARFTALRESRCDLICFVDDDNWLDPLYLRTAVQIMSDLPRVGACGGYVEAMCEIDPPSWFLEHEGSYAVGPQGDSNGEITRPPGYLWTAGLVVRKIAWHQLVEDGFTFRSVGRQGNSLIAGEDSELCLALRQAGWQLRFSPRLRMKHFIPTWRLDWRYLRSLKRGYGASRVVLEAYKWASTPTPHSWRDRLVRTWIGQVIGVALTMARHDLLRIPLFLCRAEGKSAVLHFEHRLGRLLELLRHPTLFVRTRNELRSARWMSISEENPNDPTKHLQNRVSTST